jgi:NAD-dependent deacetylase
MRIPFDAPLVILSGAGISAESGVKTFRDSGGLWENHRLEDVATPEAFERDPDLVQHFYNLRRMQLKDVEPHSAHRALANLEMRWPGDLLLITQNVDDLHERAGSKRLIHLHGELLKARCLRCDQATIWESDLSTESLCPNCLRQGRLRPDIVWFGEIPFELPRIFEALDRCALFVSIGTSGQVYPAAGFVQALNAQAHSIEINLEPSQVQNDFKEHRYGKASLLVPAFVEELLGAE